MVGASSTGVSATWRVVTLLVAAAMTASACSALTPASSGPDDASSADSDGTGSAGDVGAEPSDGGGEEPPPTTATVPLPDPIWQELALELVPMAELEEPIAFSARSGSLNYYVAERAGRIRVIERSISDSGRERISLSSRVMLDLSDRISTEGEGGLLGITFSTDGRLLYVNYTDLGGNTVVSEFNVARSNRANPDEERVLLQVEQPFANHNGGDVKIGDDGFLYIGLGDGGGSGDPVAAGQDLDQLLGKLLRIDPVANGDAAYTIPNGNPFFDDNRGRPEIWLWGARNPWRFSFDSATGDLWVADVGQDQLEEINLLTAGNGGGWGANLGWNQMEGSLPFEGGAEPADHHPPLFVYGHEGGRCSVTGGHVYRGQIIALLQGVYVFGDFCSGEILGLQILSEGVLVRPLDVSVGENQLAAFGEGPDGELLVIARSGGEDGLGVVYRLEPAEVEAPSDG